MLQIVYNMVDMIVVGHKLGKVGLSAVSVGGDVANFLTFLAMGFSNAGQVIISQFIGAGNRKKIGRFIGTMFHFLMTCAILRGMGDSIRPFIFISIAAIVNIVLDMILVIGLNLGSLGAAVATVFSQAISFISCGVYMLKKRELYDIQISGKDFLKPDGNMLSGLVKLGFPMAIKNASVQFSKLFVNSWINSYGMSVSAFAGDMFF